MSVAEVSFLFDSPEVSSRVSGFDEKPKRDTKTIGDRSEVAVLAALAQRGYLISIPFGENHRYDLIADDGSKLLRIQVKTGRLRTASFSTTAAARTDTSRSGSLALRPYFGEIDYLAVYCPQNGKTYLIPEAALVRTMGSLRLEPTENRQGRRIRWAAEYELP